MATIIIMPKQGQSVESCIITTLYKKKDDTVKKGDVLFSYETDKASFEEGSPADGTVLACFYGEGDEVPVLENMMIIGEPGEDISALLTGSEGGKLASSQAQDDDRVVDLSDVDSSASHQDTPRQSTPLQTKNVGKQFMSPRAKQLAKKNAVPLSQLVGTGPKGRIIENDVRTYLADRPKMTPLAKKVAVEEGASPEAPGTGLAGRARASDLAAPVNATYRMDYEDRKLSNMRKLIARSMHASLQNSAQLTHHLGADARRMLELRKKAKTAQEEGKIQANITLNDMVCYAVIRALKKFPEVNTHFLGDTKRYFHKVHLGLAVDTERGLMVPVLRNADDLSIVGLSSQLRELAMSCRSGSVNPDLLASEAATFTVSNLGNYGVEIFTPVINLPQSAILGVNTILPRPKDLGDGVYAFVPHIGLSLTYDHRSLDGGEATRFLKQIATEIENLEFDFV